MTTPLALKAGVNAADAQDAIRVALSLIEEGAREDYQAVLAGILSGELSAEEAGEALAELAEEVKEAAEAAMADALDEFWDFTDQPGGPVGAALEQLDGPFWAKVTAGLGDLGLAAVAWVRDAFTFDELERANRAEALTERADELELLALDARRDGKKGRERRLSRRAARKRTRALQVVA